MIGLGLAYDVAQEKRIEADAKKTGYVPYGSDPNASRIENFGRFMLDPTFGAAVPLEKRFHMSTWREGVKAKADAKQPGEKLAFDWQVGNEA